MNLIPDAPGKPGRPKNISARAWISRRRKNGVYHSNVKIMGKVHRVSTRTRNQQAALDFNLTHLRQELFGSVSPAKVTSPEPSDTPSLFS